jgi:hypothetical protein
MIWGQLIASRFARVAVAETMRPLSEDRAKKVRDWLKPAMDARGGSSIRKVLNNMKVDGSLRICARCIHF